MNNNDCGDAAPARRITMTIFDAQARPADLGQLAAPTQEAEVDRWRALVGEVGAGVAAPLTSALERIVALAASGRIDRLGLRALREDVERARQVGIESQQLARLADGHLHQAQERIDVAEMLDGVLAHRAREVQARGLLVHRSPARPTEVLADAPLLFNLLNTLLSWALDCAQSSIQLAIAQGPWPAPAELSCRFMLRSAERSAEVGAWRDGLDSMHWRLLEHTARALGIQVARQIADRTVAVVLGLSRAAGDALQGMSAIEMDDGFAPAMNSRPLAGSHVLVLAHRREVRNEIRGALRDMGLIVDCVSSVDEAEAFCREGLPHAIVVEALLRGERFDALRDEIAAEVPSFVFIEIVEEGRSFEMSGFTPASMARVGRDTIARSLPSVLLFELSRGD
jgi:hypothetical protein